MREPPNKIWLQYYGDSDEPLLDGGDADEVTWCAEKINARDVEYVRAGSREPFGFVDPDTLELKRAKDDHRRGATVWPVYLGTTWLDRLEKIEAAAENLVKVKSEQAMKALIEAVNIPHF